MILLISIARNAVFVEVTGCPCSMSTGNEIIARYARSGLESYAMAIANTVAMRVETPEPQDGDEKARRVWELKRALAAGVALIWAAENKVALATGRREEPLVDGAGVFSLEGWKEVH